LFNGHPLNLLLGVSMKSTVFMLTLFVVIGCSSLTSKHNASNKSSFTLGLELIDQESTEYNPAKGVKLIENNASIDYQISSAALCLAFLDIEEIRDVPKGHSWCFVSMKLGGKLSGASAELLGVATAHLAVTGDFAVAMKRANAFYETIKTPN